MRAIFERAAPWVSMGLLACAATSERAQRPAAAPADSSIKHAAAPEPAGADPTPSVPEPSVPAPSVPAPLSVVVEGGCPQLAVSAVGDATYVGAQAWLAKLGPEHQVAARLDFEVARADITRRGGFRGLVGYPEGPLVALFHRGIRGATYVGTDLRRRRPDGTWSDMNVFGEAGTIRRAWRWYDRSILVLGSRVWDKGWDGDGEAAMHLGTGTAARLGVALGRPKAPHVSAFKKDGVNCPIGVWDLEATPRGDVVGVVGCRRRTTARNHGVWIMRWFQDDSRGKTVKVSEDDWEDADIAIAPDGHAFVAIAPRDRSASRVFERDGDGWRELEAPAGRLEGLALGVDHALWVSTAEALWRRTETGLVSVGPPGVREIASVAGVEFGTPWVIADGRAWTQGTDGAWLAAATPAPAFNPTEGPLELRRVAMLRAGEAWVWAKYASPWPKQMGAYTVSRPVQFSALLSNVSPKHPLRCGVAVDPAHDPVGIRRWPRGYTEVCDTKLLALMRVRRFGPLDGYKGLRALLRRVDDLEVVEVEGDGGATKVIGVYVHSDAQIEQLTEGVRAYRRATSKPELLCGDESALAAAGFSIVRRLRLADGGGAFQEAR